jgi:hypothetical protein
MPTSWRSWRRSAIIYALVFMCLLTLSIYTGPDTYSVDHYLEQRISWWWKVAEFGHPVQARPTPVVPVVTAAANGVARPAPEPAGRR